MLQTNFTDKKETAVNLEKDPQLDELNPRQEPHGLFKRKVSLMTMPASKTPRLHGRVRQPPPAEPQTSAESWSLLASNEALLKNTAAGWSSHEALPLHLEMCVFVPIDCALSILFGKFLT